MMQRKQRPPPTRGRGQRKMIFLIKLRDGVWTEVPTFAGFAMLAYPDFIKLIHRLLHDFRVISQDASLEVTNCFSFHADAGTC